MSHRKPLPTLPPVEKQAETRATTAPGEQAEREKEKERDRYTARLCAMIDAFAAFDCLDPARAVKH